MTIVIHTNLTCHCEQSEAIYVRDIPGKIATAYGLAMTQQRHGSFMSISPQANRLEDDPTSLVELRGGTAAKGASDD